ncbi:unnamed protein product [Auanema sp. JU1783]|nr:unnamed protein product [Auanema sp. JU1783]
MSRPAVKTISSTPLGDPATSTVRNFRKPTVKARVSTADATNLERKKETEKSKDPPVVEVNKSKPKESSDVEGRQASVLEEIQWKTLVLGSHYPEDFDSGNWTSRPGDTFPFDIVIGLDQVCNVYKVLLDVDDNLLPKKIEISIGLGDASLPINYKNAREANFKSPVAMEYFKRERSRSRLETKTAFVDKIGQYVWLQIHEPLRHSKNPAGQIKITSFTILGYRIAGDDFSDLLEETKNDDFRPTSRDEREYKLYNSMEKAAAAKAKAEPIERHSYNGDGMKTNSDLLASDPLTTLRTVKKTLENKRNVAKETGRDVEATVCHRAVQRLLEYEAMVEDLHVRRSNALVHGDLVMAERHRLAMVDCRDTALRSIHVDLLFDKAELRAIGTTSEWSEKP